MENTNHTYVIEILKDNNLAKLKVVDLDNFNLIYEVTASYYDTTVFKLADLTDTTDNKIYYAEVFDDKDEAVIQCDKLYRAIKVADFNLRREKILEKIESHKRHTVVLEIPEELVEPEEMPEYDEEVYDKTYAGSN